jgi:hypothetical protein
MRIVKGGRLRAGVVAQLKFPFAVEVERLARAGNRTGRPRGIGDKKNDAPAANQQRGKKDLSHPETFIEAHH